jgi:ABC-type Fe3+/spermidine/putrescine transport system ATPase subunit
VTQTGARFQPRRQVVPRPSVHQDETRKPTVGFHRQRNPAVLSPVTIEPLVGEPTIGANFAIIEAHDLVKRFGGVTAVDHISFAVPEGVVFGFLGPNGAGKTTTIKILTTVLTPSEGRLMIAGHDPVREPLLVRRAFGIVFQDPSLDGELTAAENMNLHGVLYRVPRAERRERVEALLRFVGLWERRDDSSSPISSESISRSQPALSASLLSAST